MENIFNEYREKVNKVYDEFNVLKNGKNDLMIIIPDDKVSCKEAKFIYDGGVAGVLVKNENDIILLNEIHKDVRKDFFKVKKILIVEINDGLVIREYFAQMVTE